MGKIDLGNLPDGWRFEIQTGVRSSSDYWVYLIPPDGRSIRGGTMSGLAWTRWGVARLVKKFRAVAWSGINKEF
jgi:hypothetical protein